MELFPWGALVIFLLTGFEELLGLLLCSAEDLATFLSWELLFCSC